MKRSGFALSDKKLYTTGGSKFDQQTELFDSTEQVNVYSADDSSSLTAVPSMNCKRATHACYSHAGDLFVCGGRNGWPSTCCEKLIIKEGKWKFVAEINEARIDFQIVPSAKNIWAFGGEQSMGVTNTTKYYDNVIDKWIISSPMIQKRYGHSAVDFRGKISRKKISSMKVPRFFFCTAINAHKLFCFGGNLAIETKVEYFDIYNGV